MVNLRSQILKMVQLAFLTALVVILQLIGTGIKVGPLPLSLVLVPIVIGACILGAGAGAFLGFVFGFITMLMGILGLDAFSLMLWEENPFWFVLICLLKATAAGLGAAAIYKLLGKVLHGKGKLIQTVLASISAPIINTGIFAIGMLCFYSDTATGLITAAPEVFGGFVNAFQVVFLGLAGLNFLGEFTVNLILSPVIVRIVDIVNKELKI